MATAEPQYNPPLSGGGKQGESYYQARAQALLGISPSDKSYGFLWDDFDHSIAVTTSPGKHLAIATGTGAISNRVASTKGGRHTLTTGANSASIEEMLSLAAIINNLGTEKWYFVVRQAVTTTVVAGQTSANSGLLNVAGNKSLMVGYAAGGGVGNFTLQYDGNLTGSFIDSGVAVDALDHVAEFYCKGDSKLYLRYDEGGELGAVTPASHPTDSMYAYARVANGTNAAAQTLSRDFIGCLYAR